MRWLIVSVVMGCGGGSSDEDTSATDDGPATGNGACGEVGTAAVQVLGSLLLESDAPAAGAAVRLEERNWDNPDRIYVESVTNAEGQFDLSAEIVTVADCWGTAVDYYIVGDLGAAHGERGVNSWLFTAAEGTGNGIATIELPIVLYGATVVESGGSGTL